MRFDRNFILIKEFKNGELTQNILGFIKIVNNGPEVNVSVDGLTEKKLEIDVYSNNQLIFRSLNYSFNLPLIFENLSLVFKRNEEIVAFGGDNVVLKILKNSNEQNEFKSDHKTSFKFGFKKTPILSLILNPLLKKERFSYIKRYETLIKALFNKCQSEFVLTSLVENSKWIKAKTKFGFVVLGLVFERKKPISLAIGYPSINKIRNERLDYKFGSLDYISLPSNENLGYYLSFRRASDGKKLEIIKKVYKI